eukprot:4946237-Prymnesium_polylepis.1
MIATGSPDACAPDLKPPGTRATGSPDACVLLLGQAAAAVRRVLGRGAARRPRPADDREGDRSPLGARPEDGTAHRARRRRCARCQRGRGASTGR